MDAPLGRPTRRIIVPLVLFDISLLCLALLAAVALRQAPALAPLWESLPVASSTPTAFQRVTLAFLAFQAAVVPIALAALGQYRIYTNRDPLRPLGPIVAVSLLTFMTVATVFTLLEASGFPRSIMAMDVVLQIGLLWGWRALVASRQRARLLRGEGRRHTLFLGTDDVALQVACEMVANPLHGRRVVGFAGPAFEASRIPPELRRRDDVETPGPHAKDLAQLVAANVRRHDHHLLFPVATNQVDDVARAIDGLYVDDVLVSPGTPPVLAEDIVRLCRVKRVDVHLLQLQGRGLGTSPYLWNVGRFAIVGVFSAPIPLYGRIAKRAIDIAVSSVALLVSFPILAVAALAIRLEDRRVRPVYWGTRVGLKGQPFQMPKLATMVHNADDYWDQIKDRNQREGPWFKVDPDRDPRLLKVGRFLRKYSLNELPQFWSVLRGDMSLVGPRPPIPSEAEEYVRYDFRYYRCLDVKPGLTGLWQVTARDDPSFERRVQLDLDYIAQWSLWLDLKIIVRTPWTVLSKTEA